MSFLPLPENALGLCHVLARPCPKPEPQMWDLGPELRDKWEIPRSEVQLLRKLGQGNFGEVYYGKWRNNIEVRRIRLMGQFPPLIPTTATFL